MEFLPSSGFPGLAEECCIFHHNTEGVKWLAVFTAQSFGRVSTHALYARRVYYEDKGWQKWPYCMRGV
jgi:hypothetical protein